jgi:hypothetical protein
MARKTIVERKREKQAFPFYPFLFALFPIIAELSVNIQYIKLSYILRPAIISLIIGAVLYGLGRLLLRRWDRAAIITSWLLLLFFSYGHVFNIIEGVKIGNFEIGHHRYLIILWLLLAIGGCFFFYWLTKRISKITGILNAVSVFLIIVPLLFTSVTIINQRINTRYQTSSNVQLSSGSNESPDVYYIILDQYTRQDMLFENHGFDNSDFVQKLQDLGFYVAPCSQSNYGMTSLSLASSLNMNYVESINPEAIKNHINWTVFGANIKHSLVQEIFKKAGYKTISFETGVVWSEVEDSDLYITRRSNPTAREQGFGQVSDFELFFWRTTLFRFVEDYNQAFWYKWFFHVKSPDEDQYDRILFDLDQLEMSVNIPGPKYVYLHLVSPHEPFVIDKNGQFSPNPDHATGYLQQVEYLDMRIPEIMQYIIEHSSTPPIIVIQADHGDEWEERMAILNAYYFPGNGKDALYPTISPVNTFRLIFDEYFGQDFPLLDDVSYFSRYDQDYYNFTIVNYGCQLSP